MAHQQQDLAKEALRFTNLLAEQYYVKRDLDALPYYMIEEVSWIGTGADEFSRNLNEAREALTRELAEYGGVFTIAESRFDAVTRGDKFCVVYGALRAVPDNSTLSEENLRLTLVLEKHEEGLKLVHLHLSHPDQDQERGHYYVPKTARGDADSLRLELAMRGRQLENLTKNIPGGAHQCKNDQELTLISMSDGFFSMFGYTREEVHTLFHDRFMEMIYPNDRTAMLRSVQEQLKKGRDLELEYRVFCKDSAPVWVLDKGRLLDDGNGGECFYCLLIEITSRKRAEEELRLSLERHQVIMDQATDIIFDWDIKKDTLNFSPNWYKKFGYDAISTRISDRIPLSRNIHPDDITAFVKIMRDSAAGVPYSETEFRIKNIKGRYFWCRIRATVQFDSDGRPTKAVGVIVDIDDEKKEKQTLLDMAQRDALTGLYNKAAINSLVERRMREGGTTAFQVLLIIDVDFFKSVNDTYGHLTGDSLLSDVAAVLKGQVRFTDLVGRIGGDEFLIYFPEVADKNAAVAKAEKLRADLGMLTPKEGTPPITCSIGAAVFPHGAIDYFALYKCADQALYVQKNNGRGGVTFYQPSLTEKPPCGLSESAVSPSIGSDEGWTVDGQMAQYAFRTLYTAEDLESTLWRLLEIIGRSFGVSRTYIFESSEDGAYCSNTFEWCSEGVPSELDRLQNLSYAEDLDDYPKNFDGNGLFYCADVRDTTPNLRAVLEPQGIRSMLQCAILDGGEFVGYVGFDECRSYKAWDPRQVAAFKLTADVLSAFLVKLRQKQKLKKAEEAKGQSKN